MKKAIFLYDRTGIMAQPWADAGYLCYCFDGQHQSGPVLARPNIINYGMWLKADFDTVCHINEIVGEGVEFVFGFPECTDLAVCGARAFTKKLAADPECQNKAANLAKLVEWIGLDHGCPWAAENPVSVLSTLWRKPNFIFHPWEYGGYLSEDDVHPLYPDYIVPRDAYPKKTCIWASVDFMMPEKKPVEKPVGYSKQYSRLGGKSLKVKNIRSATPRGFAKAVFLANKDNYVSRQTKKAA